MTYTLQLLGMMWLLIPHMLSAQAEPIPLEEDFLLYLQDKERIRLDWSVLNEQGNKYYQIERSEDGQKFQSVGQIYAYNQAGFQKYVFIDRNPFPNLNYYRYLRVDEKSQAHYSNIKKVQLSHSAALTLLTPNAQQDRQIDLSLQLTQREKIKIELIDKERRAAPILLHDGPVGVGNHKIDLPSEDLQRGQFIVRIEGISFCQNMQLILL
ncbi:MAG: hypothetical protein AAF990_14755 [Bacteroidota bacterium]